MEAHLRLLAFLGPAERAAGATAVAGTGRLALRLRRILAVAAVAVASLRLVVLAVPAL